MKRVLFVCTGNICRSPAAHAVFAEAVREAGLSMEVDSAGTSDWHRGRLPDGRARTEGARRGYTLDHVARQVRIDDFSPGTLVVAMDRSHAEALRRFRPPALVLFRAYDPLGGQDVDDPYYSGAAAFSRMFDVIERTTPGLLAYAQSA